MVGMTMSWRGNLEPTDHWFKGALTSPHLSDHAIPNIQVDLSRAPSDGALDILYLSRQRLQQHIATLRPRMCSNLCETVGSRSG